MRFQLKWGFVAFFLASALGCAHVKPSGFLEDYQKLSEGEYLEKMYVDASSGIESGERVLVALPELKDLKENANYSAASAQKDFETMLVDAFSSETKLKAVAKSEVKDASGFDYELATAITDLKPGNAGMRWFAGELGAGHAKVQAEGYLKDLKTGKIVFEFADRRAGSAYGGMDITGGDGQELLKHDLEEIAKAVAKTLAQATA